MGEMAARDDLEGQGEGIMDEERDTGMAAMSRKDRREHTSGHIRRRQALWLAVFVGVEAEFFELHVEAASRTLPAVRSSAASRRFASWPGNGFPVGAETSAAEIRA